MMCIVNLGVPMYFKNGCTPSNSLFNHNEHKLDMMSVGGVHLVWKFQGQLGIT